VSFELGLPAERLVALFAPNTAEVLGHVPSERLFARHNLVADLAGRGTQMKLQVLKAGRAATVRLLAHDANETPVALDYLIRLHIPGRPRSDGCDEWTVCK
jgi:hypothetical protein